MTVESIYTPTCIKAPVPSSRGWDHSVVFALHWPPECRSPVTFQLPMSSNWLDNTPSEAALLFLPHFSTPPWCFLHLLWLPISVSASWEVQMKIPYAKFLPEFRDSVHSVPICSECVSSPCSCSCSLPVTVEMSLPSGSLVWALVHLRPSSHCLLSSSVFLLKNGCDLISCFFNYFFLHLYPQLDCELLEGKDNASGLPLYRWLLAHCLAQSRGSRTGWIWEDEPYERCKFESHSQRKNYESFR